MPVEKITIVILHAVGMQLLLYCTYGAINILILISTDISPLRAPQIATAAVYFLQSMVNIIFAHNNEYHESKNIDD